MSLKRFFSVLLLIVILTFIVVAYVDPIVHYFDTLRQPEWQSIKPNWDCDTGNDWLSHMHQWIRPYIKWLGRMACGTL